MTRVFIDFNINESVHVKLTDKGLRMIADKGWFLNPSEEYPGFHTFQLWDLMQKFGDEVGMCMTLPFETEIKIMVKG